MSKKVYKNKYGHYYGFGSSLTKAMGPMGNLGGGIGSALKGSGAGAIGSAVGGAVGGLIGGGMQSGAGDVFNTIGDIGSAIPGPWGAAIGAGAKILGGAVNAAFGTKVDQEALNAANQGTNYLNSFTSNANTFDDIQGPQAQEAIGDVYKGGIFSKGKAAKKNEELRRKREEALAFANRSVENNIENIADEQMNNMLASYAAFGGPLHSNGYDWTNGITIVGNGNTHEQNPLGGVPMGMAPDGQPNLVEEGEVIFNDYVFSNRLKVPNAVKEKYKLKGSKNLTFAEAAKKMQKESEERPNDPISKRGLEDVMNKLMLEQEYIREKNQAAKVKRQYAKGGKLGIMYDGDGEYPNYIMNWDNAVFPRIPRVSNTGIMTEIPRDANAVSSLASLVPRNNITNIKNIGNYDDYKAIRIGGNVTPINSVAPKLGIPDHIDAIGNYNGTPTASNNEGNKWKFEEANLRYAPIVGSAISSFTDLLGLTNKPDYSNADMIMNAANNSRGSVHYTPIGDYMRYTPFDRMFYANQLGAQAGATRRNILNTSGGNRGTAMAGLLAADYNAQNQLGNMYRQAEEYNLAQRQKVADFNRATNMFNIEKAMQADIANQKDNGLMLEAARSAAALRDSAKARADAARSANLSNLFQGLGDLGREAMTRNMIRSNPSNLYLIDRNGYMEYVGNKKQK